MTEEGPVPDLMSTSVKELVRSAQSLGLTWTLRIATVESALQQSGSLKAIYDGDTTAVTITNMTGQILTSGTRVYCVIIPPSGNFAIGFPQVPSPIGIQAQRSLSAQALPNATPTVLSWDNVVFDSSGFAGALFPTIVVPEGLAGIYGITSGLNVTASGNRNFTTIFVGANRFVRSSFVPGEDYIGVSGVRFLDVGDQITVDAFQNSGGLGAVIGIIWMYRIG